MSDFQLVRSVQFQNYKALKQATLPLEPVTLIIGPNGSGKSTAIEALRIVPQGEAVVANLIRSASAKEGAPIVISVRWASPLDSVESAWTHSGVGFAAFSGPSTRTPPGFSLDSDTWGKAYRALASFRVYTLSAPAIASQVTLTPSALLSSDGSGLAGVLDRLRDEQPERFEEFNEELRQLLPEFDRVLFETPNPGTRALLLRTRRGQHAIPASNLSHGTLLSLALMTLAYAPGMPRIIAIEEPERGIHPRLLADIRDALFRLASPTTTSHPPTQVIITSHSPYMLDLFRDHPDRVVIAHKDEHGVEFQRLVDRPDFETIIGDAQLSEAWYSGILGGIPLSR